MVKKVWAPIVTKTCGIRTIEIICIRIDKDGNYEVKNKKNVTFTIPKEYVWDPDLKDGKEPTKEERESLALGYKQYLVKHGYDVDSKELCLDRRTKSLKL